MQLPSKHALVGLLVLLSASFVAAVTRAGSNPLGEVLDLLADLTAKITKEGEVEAAAFKEYAEWCDDVSTNKKFEITTATSQKEKLEATISELSATIEAAGSKIESLASDVSTASKDLQAATKIRETEAADFATGDKELLDVIDTLARAIAILDKEMQKNPAAFAQIANGSLKNILQSLGSVVDAAAFSATDKQHLLALVQSREGVGEDDSDLGAPAADVYKTHSSNIFDVLEDLKEKAEGQLSDLRKSEVNAKHNFEMLKQSLEDQIAADSKDLEAEKSAKAAAEESKATAEGDLSVTIADLDGAKKALATATATCTNVAENHEATVKARNEELKVIADAMEVLKSSSSGAVSQTYSLVQVTATSNIRSRSDLKRSEVITLVKSLARKHGSAALAQLASRIAAVMKFGAASGADPFAKVKALIEDMISRLQAEAGSEATEKAYCDEELAKTAAKKDELDSDIAKLTSKIDQAAARSAELKADVKELQQELATMAKEQAEMSALRQKTHASYLQAKADLEEGLTGVRRALVILREYYAQKDESAAFVQQPALPEQHAKSSDSATSIIGILEVVESDFATNLAKEETEEAAAQESFEKITQENKITKATKDGDVKYKTQEYTALDKTITELASDREISRSEEAAVLEYDAKLKERCIAKPETYEARKQRRQAEIAGLKEALTILEGESSLVQRGLKHNSRHMRGALAVPIN